jgi:pilus assembly protein CpaB
MLSGRQPAPVKVVETAPAETVRTTEILVAKRDLPMGTALTEQELAWVSWPQELAASTMIQRSARPGAIEEFKGAITRQSFFSNEPIREEKVIKGNGSGFLSAILPSGKRAIAISIDSRGATSAGGFILPNDYVDVITTKRDLDASQRAGSDVYNSSTILTNIRVLAIGQNIQEKNGERVVVGETATLELDPSQAELITLHQRSGALALALRSLVDANMPEEARAKGPANSVTIVRFGVAQEVSNR